MDHPAGIDVSLATSAVCILDAAGRIVREAKVGSEPEELAAFLTGCGHRLLRIGLEEGALSQWLHAGLVRAGLPAILVGTRHVKAALPAMRVRTDRNDGRGIAQLIRLGWFRPVPVKAVPAQEARLLLTARKQIQARLPDLEGTVRGLLRVVAYSGALG